jgi:hypothetical protein
MSRADHQQRALRRELLLVRAAAEREALAERLDTLETRASSGLAGLLFGGASGARWSGPLGLAASALRVARRQPWLVPAVAGVAVRLARSRALRWAAFAAVIAGVVWWATRGSSGDAAAAADDGESLSDDYD